MLQMSNTHKIRNKEIKGSDIVVVIVIDIYGRKRIKYVPRIVFQ